MPSEVFFTLDYDIVVPAQFDFFDLVVVFLRTIIVHVSLQSKQLLG